MPGQGKGEYGKYWCFTTTCLDAVLQLGQLVAFLIYQIEAPPGVTPHIQGYMELKDRMSRQAAQEAVGLPVNKKGKKAEYSVRCDLRWGAKDQAAAYCCSTWFCHECHVGDHQEVSDFPNLAWPNRSDSDVATGWDQSVSGPQDCWRDHTKCVMSKDSKHKKEDGTPTYKKGDLALAWKGKQGPAVVLGEPVAEGRGGKRDGAGHGATRQAIVEYIKTGASLTEVHEKFPQHVLQYNNTMKDLVAMYSRKPTPSQYTLEQCCETIRQHPIEWDHPDWQHSVVVMGNPGVGKTEWALAHFKAPLLVNHPDDLKAFDPERFDGIVFDDMSFAHMPRAMQIYLCDWTQDRSIHCRFINGRIPKHTRKIFTCNYDQFPFIVDEAIKDRLQIIEIDKSLVSKRKRAPKRRVWTDGLKPVDDTDPPAKKHKPRVPLFEQPCPDELGPSCGWKRVA